MTQEINRWTVILIISSLALGYGFAVLNMKILAPALAADVSGVRQITRVVDTNFARYDKALQDRIAKLERRVGKLEKE